MSYFYVSNNETNRMRNRKENIASNDSDSSLLHNSSIDIQAITHTSKDA